MSRFQDFMRDQVKEIERFLKKEKNEGHQVSDNTIHKWIEEESEYFRYQWYHDHT